MIRMTTVAHMVTQNMNVYLNVLLVVLRLTRSEDCVIDNRTPETAWEQQLRNELISCSSMDEPPNTNNTQVFLAFIIKSFYFDNKEEVFTINSWLSVSWKDSRLKWNASDYDGITKIDISSVYIWTPSMKLYNVPGYDDMDFYMTTCHVMNKGQVLCVEPVLHQVKCSTKLNDWPYDRQNCTFKFGPRTENNGITFDFDSSRSISVDDAEHSPRWDIVGHSGGRWSNSSTQFYFSFLLERHGVGLSATIITPSLVLATLTVLSMSLNVEDKVRLGIQCFGLLNQFLFLQEISSDIPKHSANTPTVLIFLRTSLVLTLAAIGTSFILCHLRRRTTPPPNYIMTLCERVLEPYGKYFIWPRWKIVKMDKIDEVARKISTVWIDFASIVNFLVMLIITIIYLITYFTYIPQKQ